MRSLASVFLLCVAISVALIVGLHMASAGTPEAPELTDAAGDCAVPYGNAYLDVTSAWVDAETADTFDVHLQLAGFESEVAEGSGYAVQFTHQGVQWGIVAVYSAVLTDGWQFSTGQASAELAQGFEDAPGSFDEAAALITVTFAKTIFPHTDMNDTTLRDFVAMSADLRPATPFYAAQEFAPVDGNGRWILCDEAVGTLAYEFGSGHGSAHAQMASADASNEGADASADRTAEAAVQDPPLTAQSNEKDTPIGMPLVVAALALAALASARRR